MGEIIQTGVGRRRSRDSSLADQLSGIFIVFGAIVGGAAVVTAASYAAGWAWFTPAVEHSQRAMQDEESSYSSMLSQENSLRGYLLTHDVRFLEPYTRAASSVARSHKSPSSFVGPVESAELASLMVRARLAEERWHEQWAKAAANTSPGAKAPSVTQGRDLFSAYQTAHAAFAEALAKRRDHLAAREQYIIQGRVFIELVVFMVVFFLAMRQHHTLRSAVVEPVAALLRHIRRIRDGHLQATADPVGPRELAELAEGLNEVVRSLIVARELAASRDRELSDHSLRLHQILDASREFAESLNLRYVVGSVRQSTAMIGGYEHVVVWLMSEQKLLIDSEDGKAATANDSLELHKSLAGRAAKSGRITFEGPAGQVRFSDSSMMPVRAIAIPLVVGARVVGVLEARHSKAQVTTPDAIEVLEMLAMHAATAIESAHLHELIETRSHVDALTRLLNRRRLDEDLETECQRCSRYSRPLAFVMLDVDHFKEFNDTHGHPQADTALQAVADVLAGCVRATDTAYRYGGEEFCIMLRETSAKDAMVFAERVRMRIEQRFISGEILGITASFGVAELSVDAATPRALIEAADAAMYESKHGGRNRVALSVRPPPPVQA